MPESFASRAMRWKFNLFPAYRGTGGRVVYIADDWHEVRVKIPLSRRTRNYVGTIYGGSMYGAVDPIYMLMLIKMLGRNYVVWDKAAKIRFRRPGKETLYADFAVTEDEIAQIKRLTETERSIDRVYEVELKDRAGKLYCVIEKTLYIAKKEHDARDV
ncbi:MAG: PaaI family thioesterase [Pyrinomonadaceae bacterium]